jgi:uncharacterized protein (TIGR02246 family)
MNKEQFLQKLHDEQAAWEQFLANVPVTQHEQVGFYGKWRVKDVVGHVAAWERYMTARLRAHLRNDAASPHELWGEFIPPTALEDDALNDWMAAQISERAFDAVLGMQREVRAQLIGTIQATSEELLTGVGARVKGLPYHQDEPFWTVIASMSYNHTQDHMTGLQGAMAQSLPPNPSSDQEQVTQLYQQMLDRWNQRDAVGMGALHTVDANVIGFDGSQMNGREEVATVLGNIFAHHPTAAYVGKVREVRLLNGSTALLRAVVGMIPPGATDINPAVNAIQSLVAVKEAGEWRIALFHNTPAAFHGRPEASAALTEELRQLVQK